ncbi:MAG: hypothetical protein Q4P34_03225 [Tissierellia bacterium]|nr:hypothetical protein [Tissierellia bacterium]
MNDVLLINKCRPDTNPNESVNLSMVIGQMHKQRTCDLIVEILSKTDYIDISKLVFKYDGIVVSLEISKIPQLLSLMLENDVKVYNIYEIYE